MPVMLPSLPIPLDPSPLLLALAGLEATMITVVLAIGIFALQQAGAYSSKRLAQRFVTKAETIVPFALLWLITLLDIIGATTWTDSTKGGWLIVALAGLALTPWVLWFVYDHTARVIDPVYSIQQESRSAKTLHERSLTSGPSEFKSGDAFWEAAGSKPAVIRTQTDIGKLSVHVDQIIDLTSRLAAGGPDPRAFSGLAELAGLMIHCARKGLLFDPTRNGVLVAVAGSRQTLVNDLRRVLTIRHAAIRNFDHATIVEVYNAVLSVAEHVALSEEYRDAPADLRLPLLDDLVRLNLQAADSLIRDAEADVALGLLERLRRTAYALSMSSSFEIAERLVEWGSDLAERTASDGRESFRREAQRLMEYTVIEFGRHCPNYAPRLLRVALQRDRQMVAEFERTRRAAGESAGSPLGAAWERTIETRGLSDLFRLPAAMVERIAKHEYPALHIALDVLGLVSHELARFYREVFTEIGGSNTHLRLGLVGGAYRVLEAWVSAGRVLATEDRRQQVDRHLREWLGLVHLAVITPQARGRAPDDCANDVFIAFAIESAQQDLPVTREAMWFFYRSQVAALLHEGGDLSAHGAAMTASELLMLSHVSAASGMEEQAGTYRTNAIELFRTIRATRQQWDVQQWQGVVGTAESYLQGIGGRASLIWRERLRRVTSPEAVVAYSAPSLAGIRAWS